MSADWYQNFFSGLVVELWSRVTTQQQTQGEADFLVAELGLKAGARVLDAPCGNGRHAIELARRGFRAVGVDISDEFLARARQASDAVAGDVDWLQADMQCLPELGALDGAYSFGNALGYVDQDATVRFFAAVARSLAPGGRLVIESYMLAESLLPNLQPQMTFEVGDITMDIAHEYNAAESRLDTQYTLRQGGLCERRTQWNWVFSAGELRRMLTAAGLATVALYSDQQRSPYHLGAPLAIVVAERSAA